MVEAKRPRGRPRKHPIVAAQSRTEAPDWTPEQGMAPVPLADAYPQMYPAEPVLLESFTEPPLTVWVYLNRAMSDAREPIPVEWPRGWPIPEPGDNVIVGGKSGFVAYRQFSPDDGKLSIVTR